MIPPAHTQAVLNLWRQRGERTHLTLEGHCMEPAIEDGDELIVQHGARRARPGDIVVFHAPDRLRVQRVLRVQDLGDERAYIVKGDRSGLWPEPVPEDAIAGKVVGVRGRRGAISFESILWRGLNRWLAWRSAFSAERGNRRSASGRVARALYAARDGLGARETSWSLLPVRVLKWLTRSRRPGSAP